MNCINEIHVHSFDCQLNKIVKFNVVLTKGPNDLNVLIF